MPTSMLAACRTSIGPEASTTLPFTFAASEREGSLVVVVVTEWVLVLVLVVLLLIRAASVRGELVLEMLPAVLAVVVLVEGRDV